MAVHAGADIQPTALAEKSLRLPTALGRSTEDWYDHIVPNTIKKFVAGWDHRLMNSAAREVLIKSVAQALPMYIMAVFKLPYSVCDDLTRMVRNFYWGSEKGKRKVHWKGWDHLLQPKDRGGMGFRDLEMFNTALLGKHGWRLMTNPDSLCARVLKGRYYPTCDFMQAAAPRFSSSTWRAIIAGRDALQIGLLKRIGDGTTISIWNDKWIPGTISMSTVCRIGTAQVNFVADLIDPSNG